MDVEQVDFINVPTRDAKRAFAWYHEVLGLPLDPKNYYDCLHPSGQGYHRIAERWMQDYALWKPPVLTASDSSD